MPTPRRRHNKHTYVIINITMEKRGKLHITPLNIYVQCTSCTNRQMYKFAKYDYETLDDTIKRIKERL